MIIIPHNIRDGSTKMQNMMIMAVHHIQLLIIIK